MFFIVKRRVLCNARQYLVAKLTDMITNGTPDFALLEEYTGIEPIDHAELTKD